jgi:hypothetical protein
VTRGVRDAHTTDPSQVGHVRRVAWARHGGRGVGKGIPVHACTVPTERSSAPVAFGLALRAVARQFFERVRVRCGSIRSNSSACGLFRRMAVDLPEWARTAFGAVRWFLTTQFVVRHIASRIITAQRAAPSNVAGRCNHSEAVQRTGLGGAQQAAERSGDAGRLASRNGAQRNGEREA